MNKQRLVVVGSKGMLGTDIVSLLAQSNDVIAVDRQELDITKGVDVNVFLTDKKPSVVINCSAYTNVDGCETNKEEAFAVNAEGVKNLSEACKKIKARFIHYSTDYVFDGKKDGVYSEDDQPGPLSVYGQSKLKGEQYIQEILDDYLILRTSWLFGKNGKNFVSTIIRLAQAKSELTVVNDQKGCPTYTADLSKATECLLRSSARGVFNVSNSGYCTWFEFALQILKVAGISHVKVMPMTTEQLNRPAPRPRNSILSGNKFYVATKFKMPEWQDSLIRYLEK